MVPEADDREDGEKDMGYLERLIKGMANRADSLDSDDNKSERGLPGDELASMYAGRPLERGKEERTQKKAKGELDEGQMTYTSKGNLR